jgi:uncharacterized protein YprB with RNaseH-like and TPR domain/predicted nuclease with RNAse H fold/dephospho-CoA kinase
MLRSTFRHLNGIGFKRERQLWETGVFSWDDLRRHRIWHRITRGLASKADLLDRSEEALAEGDAAFFAERLPSSEHWRIAVTFPAHTMFLDIETTGLSLYYDTITLIGWGMDCSYGVHLADEPPDKFVKSLLAAKVLVTFNGSHFDLPFLRSSFPGLELPKAHIDLRYAARRIGLAGSQKEIELLIGRHRPHTVSDLDGSVAPLLWSQYQRGDLRAFRRLVSYNHADIEGMRSILKVCTAASLRSIGIPASQRRVLSINWPKAVMRWTVGQQENGSAGVHVRPYTGHVGPRVVLSRLPTPILTELRTVVGVDLTGSEARPSGWARIDGAETTTARMATDEELFEQTVMAVPDLVSIDAPLSLPRGRLTVSDDDIYRQTFGIMRECERILKRRGINVYPCLIRSMQALTARGIRLAIRFRQAGIPVIESFPGAVQDVLGIPRKRKSIDWLRRGLVEFGLRGPFVDGSISHDELDAISSALVGQMFWVGCTEALGNEDEDYLIIPKIGVEQNRSERGIVGLSGRTASGKTAVAEILQSLGFARVSVSGTLTGMLQARDLPISRYRLQSLGSQIRREQGQRWLDERVVEQIGNTGRYVVDGLRFPEDHAFFVERFGSAFVHLHIDAPQEVRLRRFLRRGGSNEEFWAAETHETEAHAPIMRSLSHRVVANAGSLNDLTQLVTSSLPLPPTKGE